MKNEGAKLNKRWNLLYKNIDAKTVLSIENAAEVSPLLALLMAVRNVTPEEAQEYIKGGMQSLHDPFLLRDMDIAVERIQKAMVDREKICVYGDYDVDGISSVSMLLSYFKAENIAADFYIPDREKEGYGLNADAIRRIAENGVTLLITVDTGITAIEETQLAKSLGIDVIITDHHSVGEVLPQALAIVNPKRPDCNYPFKALAGAGVAFKLISALCNDVKKAVTEYCDIAALATIADVVSLSGENRVITALGLRKMRKLPSVGLSALFETAGITGSHLSSYQVSFGIAPRLNAAGRMGNSLPAVRLLQTDSMDEAAEIAAELEAQNNTRKALGDVVYEEAVAAIEAGDYDDKQVIVLAKNGWHHGIIGITASKIAEQYYKSTFLISTDGQTGKGSGRSIPGLNLYEALRSADDLLIRYGGHALAAGLTINVDKIDALSDALNAYAMQNLTPEDLIPSLDIDAPLDISLPLLQVAKQLELLEPFGAGNAKPVFLISDVTLSSVRTSKDEKHLFLRLFKKGSSVDCVAFRKGELASQLSRGDTVDIVGELHLNTYSGVMTPQIIMQDIRIKK